MTRVNLDHVSSFSFYCYGVESGILIVMVDFEQFVKGLGPYAKCYTREQLKQLHIEVRKLAEVLLEAHRVARARARKINYPQPAIDQDKKTVH